MDDDPSFLELRRMLRRLAPVPDVELDYLRAHLEPRRYTAGTALIEMGEVPSRGWYLAGGFLRFFYVTPAGREFNKAFSRPGDLVLPLAAVVTGRANAFVIAAVTEARTLAFPTSIIPHLYERHPSWERIGRLLAEQMALRKETRERELLLEPAIVRFRRFSERYPELVGRIPQREIASFIGVTEQALSRLLRINRG